MKKLPFLLSLLLVAALLLAACGGNANNNALETPVVEDPILQDDDLTDDDLNTEVPVLDPTPTELVEEPVLDATETPLADDMVDETETPVAGDDDSAVPVTGDDGDFCYPNRLSHLAEGELVDQNGNLIGEIEGVIVFRNNVMIMSEDMLGDDDDDLTTDDNAGVDEQPAVDPNAQAGVPAIAYLLIDIDDNLDLFEDDRDILIPYGALTVVNERTDLGERGECVFTFTQDVTVLQEAPFFEDGVWEDDLDLRLPDWDAEYNTYWTGQGVTVANVNETGEQQANISNAVFLDDGFSFNVRNYVDEDLGEIVDFIIDPQSGNFVYGILARGSLLGMGGDHYPVPMEQLTWVHFEDDVEDATEEDFDLDDRGEFLLDINDEAFDEVEGMDNLDDVDFFAPDWSADYDAFWLNRQPAVEE